MSYLILNGQHAIETNDRPVLQDFIYLFIYYKMYKTKIEGSIKMERKRLNETVHYAEMAEVQSLQFTAFE